MAPVIWGLDLAEIKWGKFKNSNMWNNKYHLRRSKFIVYQLAMILCVVSESLGTAALSDYLDEQNKVWKLNHRAVVHNNDYIGAASYNIFAGVFNAFIFGAAFFFDLFWPERWESKGVRVAWKACGILSVLFVLSSALTLTIITATQCAYVSGVSREEGAYLVSQFHKDGGAPLCYKNDGRALAAVVFIWPGWAFTFASCVILFYSIDHIEMFGPKSGHERQADARRMDQEQGYDTSGVQRPEPAYRLSGSTALQSDEDEDKKYEDAPELQPTQFHDNLHAAAGAATR